MSPLPKRSNRSGKRIPAPVRRLGGAFSAGGRATVGRLKPMLGPLARRAGGALAEAARGAVAALRAVDRAGHRRALAGWRALGRAVDRAAVAVRPEPVWAGVAAFAAAMLALSQFLDYRAVEIVTVERDQRSAGSAHAYLILPLALAALAAVYQAFAHGRWQSARTAAALAGVSALIALAVDVPRGLHEGSFAERYADAQAILVYGFYVELFSALVLGVCGLLLARSLRAAAPVRRRSHAGESSSARATESPLAEGSA